MSDKEPGEDARPRGGYTPGMFAEIDRVDKFAEVLGVPKQTIALVTPKDVNCRSSGCPFRAIEANRGFCAAHRRSWYPLRQHRGERWLGPEFLSISNRGLRDCSCEQQQCKSAGYFPGQGALHVKKEWRERISKTPYLFSREKSKAYQKNPDKSMCLYPWHFYPEHRERRADGEWRLKEHTRGETYEDENGGIYSYPPPHYLVQHFLDNEYFVDSYVLPQDRWAQENPDSKMPTWMIDMIAADHSFAATQNTDSTQNSLSLISSQAPDLSEPIGGGEGSHNDDDTAVKIDTFLLGRCAGSLAEADATGNNIASTTRKSDRKKEAKTIISRDRCRKEEWVSLPADPMAMACPDVVTKRTTDDNPGNSDKNALVDGNNSKVDSQRPLFCRDDGCSELGVLGRDGFCLVCFNRRRFDAMAEAKVTTEAKELARKQPTIEWQNKQQTRSDAIWQKNFDNYVAHVRRNGAVGVDVASRDNPQLYSWIRLQKDSYHNNRLDESRIKKLNEVGFDFNASKWRTCFQRLSHYVREHGTIPGSVKEDEAVSRRWWRRQLKRRERGDLSGEQLDCLREIESQFQQPEQKRLKTRTGQDEEHMSESDHQMHVEAVQR